MAKIPEYQQQFDKQNVELGAPKQQLNIPAAAFGSDGKALQEAGKGLQDTGSVLAAVRTRMGEEKAQRDGSTAHLEASKAVHDYTVNGVFNVGGVGVEGATKNFESFLDSLQEGMLEKLQGAGARDAFLEKFSSFREASRAAVATHEAKELRVANVDTQTRLAQAAAERAVGFFTNGPLREQALAEHDEALQATAKLKGMSPEATKLLVEESKSKALAQMAERFIVAGKYDEARGLVADERMLGLDRKTVEAKLRPAEVDAAGLNVAKQWIGKGIDTLGALKSAEGIQDKDVRKAALHNFSVWSAAVKHEQAKQEADATEKTYSKLDSMAGDLVAQDAYIKSMPNRKMQDRARTRYNQLYAGPQGLAGSDPTAAFDLQEKINRGELLSIVDIMNSPEASKVSRAVLERAKSGLEASQKVINSDLMLQYKRAKGYARSDAPDVSITNDHKADYERFREYVEAQAKSTNQAKDPDFSRKMAARWVLDGETSGEFFSTGRGRDRTFGDAMKLPEEKRSEWLPKLPEEGSSDRTKLDAKFSDDAFAKKAMAKYKTDDIDEAKRIYFRDLISSDIPLVPKKKTGRGQ